MSSNLALTITMGASAGGAAAVFGNIKTTLQRISAATGTLKERQKQLSHEMKMHAARRPGELERINDQYKRQIVLIDRLKQQSSALGRTQARIAAEQQARGQMRGELMGMAATGFVAARSLRVGVEFEASMSKVQSLTRIEKDSEAMKALTEQARALGAATTFTSSEAAQAQGFLAMAGFNPDQILKSMPSMLDLARAGDVDLQRTADIASNIQTAFKIDASQMTRIADTLTMAFTTSNTNLDMLAQSMKYAAPHAAALGVSLEDTAAMVGLFGNAGIQADMAGTSLRNVFASLAGPTATAKKRLDQIGVVTKDAAGNMKNMPELLYEIAKKTEGMGSGDRAAFYGDLFGKRASPAMLSMLSDTEKLKAQLDIVNNAEGAAARTAKVMADNVQGDLIAMKSVWEDLNISLFNTSKGPLRDLTQSVTEFLRGASKWVQENQALVAGIVKVISVLFGLKAGLLIGGYALSLLSSGVLGLIGVFQRARTAILLFQALGMKAAFLSLISPVGLVIAAIAALAGVAYLIYRYWEPIRGFFVGVWEQIKGAFAGGIGSIAALIVNWSPLGLFYQAFAGVLNWFGIELPEKFTEFGGQILQGMLDGVLRGAGAVIDGIKSVAIGMWTAVKDTLGISSPSRVFAELGGFTMRGLADGLRSAAGVPLAALQGMAGTLAAAGSIALAGGMASAMAAPMGGSAVAGGAASIVINVYSAPGMDEKALADLVVRKLGEAQRTAEAGRRSRLSDAD